MNGAIMLVKIFRLDHSGSFVLSACNKIYDGTDVADQQDDQHPDPFGAAGMFAADEVNESSDHQNQLDDQHRYQVRDELLKFGEVHNVYPFNDILVEDELGGSQ